MDFVKELGMFNIVYGNDRFTLLAKEGDIIIPDNCPTSSDNYGNILLLAELYTRYFDLFKRFELGELGCFYVGNIPVYGEFKVVSSVVMEDMEGFIVDRGGSLDKIFEVPVIFEGSSLPRHIPLYGLYFHNIANVNVLPTVRSLSLEYNQLYTKMIEAAKVVSGYKSEMKAIEDKIEGFRKSMG